LPAMAELQLLRISPSGEREDLIAEANAENRNFFTQCRSDGFNSFAGHLRIARPVADDKAMEFFQFKNVVVPRHGDNAEVARGEGAANIVFRAAIDKNDCFLAFTFNFWFLNRNFGDQVTEVRIFKFTIPNPAEHRSFCPARLAI